MPIRAHFVSIVALLLAAPAVAAGFRSAAGVHHHQWLPDRVDYERARPGLLDYWRYDE